MSMSEWDQRSEYGMANRTYVEQQTMKLHIRQGIYDGLSDNEVARRAGCSSQTVLRYRIRHGIPNFYKRGGADHV